MESITNKVIGIKELSALLGVSVSTINRLKREGKVPHHKIGSRVVLTPSDVEAFFKNFEKKIKEDN